MTNLKCFIGLYQKTFQAMNLYLVPFFALTLRLIIFRDFFVSGYLKLGYALNDQWDTVIYLFSEEYKTPFLSPNVAAVLGTFNELFFPVLLLVGFFSRFSALIILFMAILIEFTFEHSMQHVVWMISALYIMLYGAGMFSVDYLIHKKMDK